MTMFDDVNHLMKLFDIQWWCQWLKIIILASAFYSLTALMIDSMTESESSEDFLNEIRMARSNGWYSFFSPPLSWFLFSVSLAQAETLPT